jgi:hypothetical protein
METNILLAQIDLKTTILKLETSLQDIKDNNPKRTDLIDSMEQSLNDLMNVSKTFVAMEKELQLQHHRIMTLERLNNEIQTELNINKF